MKKIILISIFILVLSTCSCTNVWVLKGEGIFDRVEYTAGGFANPATMIIYFKNGSTVILDQSSCSLISGVRYRIERNSRREYRFTIVED